MSASEDTRERGWEICRAQEVEKGWTIWSAEQECWIRVTYDPEREGTYVRWRGINDADLNANTWGSPYVTASSIVLRRVAVVSPSPGTRRALEWIREQAALEADDTPNGLIFSSIANEADRALSGSPSPVDAEREHDLLLKERDPEYPGSLAMQVRDLAERLEIAKGSAAEDHLDALRWKADDHVWNHEGEHVWLKQATPLTIADCCPYDDPCEEHDRRAAAPPVGVDEDAEDARVHRATSQLDSIVSGWDEPSRSDLQSAVEAVLDAAGPSSAAPGVTGAAQELFDANYELHKHREPGTAGWGEAKIRLERAWRALGTALAVSPAPAKREYDLQGQPLCFVCKRRQSEHPNGVECVSPAPRAETDAQAALREAIHRMATVAGRLRLKDRDDSVPSIESEADLLAEKLPEWRELCVSPAPTEGPDDE
jgi:hypothetical protein